MRFNPLHIHRLPHYLKHNCTREVLMGWAVEFVGITCAATILYLGFMYGA